MVRATTDGARGTSRGLHEPGGGVARGANADGHASTGRDVRTDPTHDVAGVVTLNGRLGIVGDTFTFGGDMNGSFWLVRSGAVVGDRVALQFEQIGSSAPATWVAYGVTASSRTTPWGDAAFNVGWKPISFSDSCWSLVVDGVNTGIVLAVGH